MIYLVNSQILETNATLPWWGWALLVVYAIGAALAIRGVSRTKKWYQKILFVVFWPYFFLRIFFKLMFLFA